MFITPSTHKSFNKRCLNLFLLYFYKDHSLSRAGTVGQVVPGGLSVFANGFKARGSRNIPKIFSSECENCFNCYVCYDAGTMLRI